MSKTKPKGAQIFVVTATDWQGNQLQHYYIERKLTLEQYRLEFGDGLIARKNQKNVVVKETLTPEEVRRLLDQGGTLTSRNGGTK